MSKKQVNRFLGIDYGSKLAGTSAICYPEKSELKIIQSEKKRDADKFILDFCKEFNPEMVFIDAPLSLPAAYFDDRANDYFYRDADRATQAMSPMFIGGLTARAMKLKSILSKQNSQVFETYPKQLVRELNLHTHYKKDLGQFKKELQPFIGLQLPKFENWHQVDAALAHLSASRFTNGRALAYGNAREGLIYV